MIAICEHCPEGTSGYSFANFRDHFINICVQHRQAGRARAFAFILYDFTNPSVHKILRDNEYWASLHKLSGSALTIFSFHHREPQVGNRGFQVMDDMIAVGGPKGPADMSTILLQRYFEIKLPISLPAILFFQVDQNEVIDSFVVELKSQYVQDSYFEIEKVVKDAVEAVSKVFEENSNNSGEVFELIKRRIHQRQTVARVGRAIRLGTSVKEMLNHFGEILNR
jgi:hypothetical protein